MSTILFKTQKLQNKRYLVQAPIMLKKKQLLIKILKNSQLECFLACFKNHKQSMQIINHQLNHKKNKLNYLDQDNMMLNNTYLKIIKKLSAAVCSNLILLERYLTCQEDQDRHFTNKYKLIIIKYSILIQPKIGFDIMRYL